MHVSYASIGLVALDLALWILGVLMIVHRRRLKAYVSRLYAESTGLSKWSYELTRWVLRAKGPEEVAMVANTGQTVAVLLIAGVVASTIVYSLVSHTMP